MVHSLFPRVLVAALALITAAAGCAHPRPAPAPVAMRPAPPLPPPPPPPKKARLVVLPLDKLALPGTAEELNTKLSRVKLPGADDAIMASTSMETAQLQSECAEPTDACYLKIAKLIEADRMLWAQVDNAGKGKKKKKNAAKLEIVLFDAEKPGVVGRADENLRRSNRERRSRQIDRRCRGNSGFPQSRRTGRCRANPNHAAASAAVRARNVAAIGASGCRCGLLACAATPVPRGADAGYRACLSDRACGSHA